MTRLRTGEIVPTEVNARSVVELTNQDLRRMYDDPDRAGRIADPDDPAHVESQLLRLRDHPGRYVGVYAARDVVAFSKVNEWRVADQIPFARTRAGALGLRAMSAAHVAHLPTRPLGIFGLAADVSLDGDEREEALDLLVRRIASRKGDRQIRMPVTDSEPAIDTLLRHGFAPTDYCADEVAPVSGVAQQLYIRQPR
jgi:hypothetical protein